MSARLLVLLALAATLAAPAAPAARKPAPVNLRAFLLRANEPLTHSFPRTPSFAWSPYAGARSYDFELATSRSFDDGAIVWSTASRSRPLQVPVVSIPVALPWMVASPYALYAHVRARTPSGVTPWSAPFGFNMSWNALPQQLLPDYPGLVRWASVEGATSYEVWFLDAGKVITTVTNAADEREYYAFHPDPAWTGTVKWRVRAVRKLYGTRPSGLPAVSTGPWSSTFVSTNPGVTSGPITPQASVADQIRTATSVGVHGLTPALVFSGNTATNGVSARLFRAYVATDRQCVNIVYRGPVVGSPAYAPRVSGPLSLPASTAALTTAESGYLADGSQGGTYGADLVAITSSEEGTTAGVAASGGGKTSSPATGTDASGTGASGTDGSATTTYAIPSKFGAAGSPVDLWDSGWPSGRYYWTVVPVREVTVAGTIKYYDAEVPQDACAAGRVLEFGKKSSPITTSAGAPYASGLTPRGALATATSTSPRFYRGALITWRPAPGAAGYEVQWSKTRHPFRPASKTPFFTEDASVLLEGLKPGTWYYRVRGIDPYVPGVAKQMTWSPAAKVVFVKPRYAIEKAGGRATVGAPAKKKTAR